MQTFKEFVDNSKHQQLLDEAISIKKMFSYLSQFQKEMGSKSDRFKPDPKIKIASVKFVYDAKKKILELKYRTKPTGGKNSSPTGQKGSIKFLNIKTYSRKQVGLKLVKVPGTDFFIEPMKLTKGVVVYCSCLDFQHRFSWHLHKFDAHIGNPIPYTRLTPDPPAGMPYVNPGKLSGNCKHIYRVFQRLQRTDLLEKS